MNSSFLGETVLQVWGGDEEEGLATSETPFSAHMETGFAGNLGFRSKSFHNRTRFYEVHGEQGHFLQACFLCKQSLGEGNDIFMYRGDTPFCSEECRQEQIDMDEAKERSWSSGMGKNVATRKEQQKSTKKSHDIHIRTRTVVAG